MILSISEAAKRFKVSRSKIYRMRDKGQISFALKSDDTIGIDLSEMIRVFGAHVSEQNKDTKQTDQEHHLKHDITTENFYLKKEVESLKNSLQKSETRVDQMISLIEEQNKQLFLAKPNLESKKSLWSYIWGR